MAIGNIDIIRPGVSLLDGLEQDWEFIGKLVPVEKGSPVKRWEDKWLRRNSSEVLTLEGVITKYGSVSVLLQELNLDYRWWDNAKTFEVREDS